MYSRGPRRLHMVLSTPIFDSEMVPSAAAPESIRRGGRNRIISHPRTSLPSPRRMANDPQSERLVEFTRTRVDACSSVSAFGGRWR